MNKNAVGVIVFRCPGLHGGGCPDAEMLAFGIGNKPKEGMSLHAVQGAVKRAGWTLAALRFPQPDGTVVPGFEPVCVDAAGGKVDPSARPYVRRVLGSETPS
jgi:hypothetical protein